MFIEMIIWQNVSGARFVGNCTLEKVNTNLSELAILHTTGPKSYESCRVTGVQTNLGHISCEYFVNCGGIWARSLGKMSEPNVKGKTTTKTVLCAA